MTSHAKHIRAPFGSQTDIGLVRDHNEDSLAVRPPLYVVCDGMGGHAAGEVASEIAVNIISQRTPAHPDAQALGQAVEEANIAILHAAAEGVGRQGMGTTCTAAMLEGERLVVAQVGDSRAYLLHDGVLQQLTRDHSLVADLVESGQITPEEARFHPKRSMITRALGSDPRTQADLYEVNVSEGDRLLLCSDGLYSMVEDDDIRSILGTIVDPQMAARALVDAALEAGGYDNVTVILVDVEGHAKALTQKFARKTKVTAAIIIAMLVAIIVGSVVLFNFFTQNAAYLGEVDGKVAVYQGVPGQIFGGEFSSLREVTDVELSSLQPGVANRIRSNDIRCDSVEDAFELVDRYEEDAKLEGSSKARSSAGEEASKNAEAGSGDDAGAGANAGAGAGENTSSSAGSVG